MLENILNLNVLQNSIKDYVLFLMIFLSGIIIIWILKKTILKLLKNIARNTETTIDDFFIGITEKNSIPILYFGSFYLASQLLILSPIILKIIKIIGVILFVTFVVRFLTQAITYMLELYLLKKEKNVTKIKNIKGILAIIKTVIWGLGVIFLLDNMGFKISAVVAGLGIGGIAIALAAQAILGDLFSYFVIFFDCPFEIGDFIIVGEYMGTIEKIGIKTTRISSLSGEQIVFANTDLTNSRIRNYKRMEKRRVSFQLGVTYQTSLQQLKEIPLIATSIIKNVDDTVFDRAHFISYGDFSLLFEIVYYVIGNDYNKYMDIQQKINIGIKEEFENKKIDFAYPTQTLFVEARSNP